MMTKEEFWEWLRERPRILLAPMAGVSDRAYRLMYQDCADLCYSEMVSATGLAYGSRETWDLALPAEGEQRLAVQLFGHDPQLMADQAVAVERRLGKKLALIDLNFACPVAKVTRKGEGSALLDHPERIYEIVQAMTNSCSCAITAKIRTGRNQANLSYLEVGHALENAGAAAVTLHGRSAGQGYRGSSDRDALQNLATQLSIPVIGSGDVMSFKDAHDLFARGCAAVMVARGSYGNPWIFESIRNQEELEQSISERITAAQKQLSLAKAENLAPGRLRKLVSWYIKAVPSAALWRAQIMACKSIEDFEAVLSKMEAQLTDD